MIDVGINHPGLPFPRVMVERLDAQARAINSWKFPAELAIAQAVAAAAFEAQIHRALICPIRFEPRLSSWRCVHCGTVDHYERISAAFLWITVDGSPEAEDETWCEETDVQTRQCLNCLYDDEFEEIPRPPRCRPDWTINLDGSERLPA